MEDIKISIITASYNYQDYIRETIESVIAQTYTNWEMIIVDDGSKDNSVEVIKNYCAKDPRIRLFQHENGVNKGLCKTIQLGIEKAETEWIAFLESDDIITPNYLEEKIKVIKEKPEVEFIFNDVQMFGERVEESEFNIWFKEQKEIIKKIGIYADYFDVFAKRNIVPTFSTVLIKKSIMQELDFSSKGGGPQLDWYLWEQVALNHKLYYIDKKLTNWRMHYRSYISSPVPEYKNMIFALNYYKLSLKRGNPFKHINVAIKGIRRFIFRCHLNQGKIMLFGKWIVVNKKKAELK